MGEPSLLISRLLFPPFVQTHNVSSPPPPLSIFTAGILGSTASAAHQAFASIASASPVKAGDAVPDVDIKINDLEDKINFSKVTGKNILVLVPGA